MHDANEIIDGFFVIRQDMETMRVQLTRYGETVKVIQPGRVLSLDELHDMLVKDRTEMFFEGV